MEQFVTRSKKRIRKTADSTNQNKEIRDSQTEATNQNKEIRDSQTEATNQNKKIKHAPTKAVSHSKRFRDAQTDATGHTPKTTELPSVTPEDLEGSCGEVEEEGSSLAEDEEEELPLAEGFSRPIPWQKIEAEGLDCDYGLLFRPKEASELFEALEQEVEYFTGDQAKVQVFGKTYDVPRKQATYGDEGLMYSFSGVHLLARPWTPTLGRIRDAVTQATGHTFNFVLVNRYKDGLDHMGEHRDDERELDPRCPIASVSLGAPRDFIFRHRNSRWSGGKGGARGNRNHSDGATPPQPVKLELAHGSLLLMNAPTNTYWYHSLPVRKRCLRARINLTFRRIIKKS